MNILLLVLMIMPMVEGWMVNQGYNKAYKEEYQYNTGILNHYVTGKDALTLKNKNDMDLWYFVSPIAIVGKGPFAVTFSMVDYTKMNTNVKDGAIILRSSMTPIYELWVSLPTEYDGTDQTYWIPLIGTSIRKKDMDGRFSKVSDRDLPKLLEKVDQIAILGDWTQGIEMIGLDNVAIEEMNLH